MWSPDFEVTGRTENRVEVAWKIREPRKLVKHVSTIFSSPGVFKLRRWSLALLPLKNGPASTLQVFNESSPTDKLTADVTVQLVDSSGRQLATVSSTFSNLEKRVYVYRRFFTLDKLMSIFEEDFVTIKLALAVCDISPNIWQERSFSSRASTPAVQPSVGAATRIAVARIPNRYERSDSILVIKQANRNYLELTWSVYNIIDRGGDVVASHPFGLEDFVGALKLYPMGQSKKAESLSIFLMQQEPLRSMQLSVTLAVISKKRRNLIGSCKFDADYRKSQSIGLAEFFPRKLLAHPDILNQRGTFTIKCEITINVSQSSSIIATSLSPPQIASTMPAVKMVELRNSECHSRAENGIRYCEQTLLDPILAGRDLSRHFLRSTTPPISTGYRSDNIIVVAGGEQHEVRRDVARGFSKILDVKFSSASPGSIIYLSANVDPDIFGILIRIMANKGHIHLSFYGSPNISTSTDLLKLCNLYDICEIGLDLTLHIENLLTDDNVTEVLLAAYHTKSIDLVRICLPKITKANYKKNEDAWKKVLETPKLVNKIIEQFVFNRS